MTSRGTASGFTTMLNIYPYLPHHQVGAGVQEEEERMVSRKIKVRTGRWTEAWWDPQASFVLFRSPWPSCQGTSNKDLTDFTVTCLYTFLPC